MSSSSSSSPIPYAIIGVGCRAGVPGRDHLWTRLVWLVRGRRWGQSILRGHREQVLPALVPAPSTPHRHQRRQHLLPMTTQYRLPPPPTPHQPHQPSPQVVPARHRRPATGWPRSRVPRPPAPPFTSPGVIPAPSANQTANNDTANNDTADSHNETADGGPSETATPSPAETSPAAAPSGRAVTAGEATRILETGLDDVSQRTRVRFQVGRVASVEGSTVIFAVPNDHYVERCRGVQGEIEEVLSAQFGQSVDLRIVVDEAGPPASLDPAKMESTRDRPTDDSIDDVGPVEDLVDATDQSFDGVERLTKAFPGSKVVEPKPE